MSTWACPHGRFASLSHSLGPSPVSLPTFYSHGRLVGEPNGRGRM